MKRVIYFFFFFLKEIRGCWRQTRGRGRGRGGILTALVSEGEDEVEGLVVSGERLDFTARKRQRRERMRIEEE